MKKFILFSLATLLAACTNNSQENIAADSHQTRNNHESSDILPLLKAVPEFPAEAIAKRIEGYCIVTYTVNEKGNVEDAEVKPGDCRTKQGEPTDIFTKTSLKTTKKFKYKPRYENGVPVKVTGVTNKLTYSFGR